MDDSSDVSTIDGNAVQTRFRGKGVNEAAVGAAARQDADRKKLAGVAAKSAGDTDMPKASDFGGDMAAYGKAMREYREKKNATPQKAMVKDRLAAQ